MGTLLEGLSKFIDKVLDVLDLTEIRLDFYCERRESIGRFLQNRSKIFGFGSTD